MLHSKYLSLLPNLVHRLPKGRPVMCDGLIFFVNDVLGFSRPPSRGVPHITPVRYRSHRLGETVRDLPKQLLRRRLTR
jgi:hypothetical protein